VRRVVVIGASLAGLRAAQAVRAGGHDGELVVVGAEQRLPYTRPPLSKELLAGGQTPDGCAFPCDTVDAEWRLGVAATGLDRHRRGVELEHGELLAYDRLVLATGSRARPWPGAGADLVGVHTLRDSTTRSACATPCSRARGSRSSAQASSAARSPRPRASSASR
jgi:NADPH-dependent 2,4-dienoyl-CoA reductase/sulfur reductase-like enzyme